MFRIRELSSVFDKLSNETRFTGLSFEKELRLAAAHEGHALRTFTQPSGIFSDVHAAGENDWELPFVPAGTNLLRHISFSIRR